MCGYSYWLLHLSLNYPKPDYMKLKKVPLYLSSSTVDTISKETLYCTFNEGPFKFQWHYVICVTALSMCDCN